MEKDRNSCGVESFCEKKRCSWFKSEEYLSIRQAGSCLHLTELIIWWWIWCQVISIFFCRIPIKKSQRGKNSELTCAEIPQAAGIISFFFSELDNIFPIL